MTAYSQNRIHSGFSLVELLVVLSIISVLSVSIYSTVLEATGQARDAQRLSDMKKIEEALFMFYRDNARFPNESIDGVSNIGQVIGVGAPIDTALAPYLSEVPRDPLDDSNADASTNWRPDGDALYYYSYDPQHMIQQSPCAPSPYNGRTGSVFGFNKSESRGVISKDTCFGANVNLDDADFNIALDPIDP